jgi:transcriptional regulator with XRE-family HTH domain
MYLADYLSSQGISAAAFAQLLGLADKSTLYRYMNGRRKPSVDVQDKILALTGGQVTLSEIISLPKSKQKQHKNLHSEQRRRTQQALYCGFAESFIVRQSVNSKDKLPVWRKWDLYYNANDNLPFPIWQAAQILGAAFTCNKYGVYTLNGRMASAKMIVVAANNWLLSQGHDLIDYPDLPASQPIKSRRRSEI